MRHFLEAILYGVIATIIYNIALPLINLEITEATIFGFFVGSTISWYGINYLIRRFLPWRNLYLYLMKKNRELF